MITFFFLIQAVIALPFGVAGFIVGSIFVGLRSGWRWAMKI